MNQRNTLIKNIASLSIVQVVNYIFPLITVPYVSRIIGPEGYGVINYATAFIAYFTVFITYGFDLTATRRIARFPHDSTEISKIMSQVTVARTLLLFVSVVVFIITVHLIDALSQNLWVSVILFSGLIAIVISPQYVFQGVQKLAIYAKVNFARGLLNMVMLFVLIQKREDYLWIPVLTSLLAILINIFLLIYAFRYLKISYVKTSLKSSLELVWTERFIFFSTIIISLYTTTNTIVLGFFADMREIGYYTTSQNFLSIASMVVTTPIATSIYPYIAKSFSISKEEGVSTVRTIAPVVFYATLAVSAGLLIFAPFCIRLFYGAEFDNSIISLRILAFTPFIVGLSNLFGIQTMLNLGLDKVFLKIATVCSIIGISLNFYMSKHFGYIGTAWNCILVETTVTIIMYFTLKRRGINVLQFRGLSPRALYINFNQYLTQKK
ncbi:flippase [Sphingobacterium spiritivorum]|uniref:flippase n=1 Tax=Sphingobacterium spiritivorum TaxID=258 RepID=UPI003DA562B2